MTRCPPTLPPLPAPEEPARVAEAHEVPLGAKRVQRAAEAAGWATLATYARGSMHAGRPPAARLVETVAVRMFHRDGRRAAVAMWIRDADAGAGAGRWVMDLAFRWVAGQRFAPKRLSAEQLRRWLAGHDSEACPTPRGCQCDCAECRDHARAITWEGP
jgi:hypothetical protein